MNYSIHVIPEGFVVTVQGNLMSILIPHSQDCRYLLAVVYYIMCNKIFWIATYTIETLC